jgi:UDP-N-acetyl-2-amino-2-deoxyglucuronate dehydrogenase
MNQGIHLVDLLVWFMGDPVAVQAYADTLYRDIEVEDVLAATLRFGNGALATITATTTTAPGFPHRMELYGTGGAIQVEGETVVRWDLADPAAATVEPPEIGAAAGAGAAADPRDIAPTGHIAVVRHLIQAVRAGRAPKIDGTEGRRSLAAVLAVYEAANLLDPTTQPPNRPSDHPTT